MNILAATTQNVSAINQLNKAKKMVLKSKNTEFKLLFNGMLGLLNKNLKKRKELEKSIKKIK